MPPLTMAGRSFLVSFDDLTFLLLPSLFIHIAWILVDTCRTVRYSAIKLDIPTIFLSIDAVLCGVMTLVDLAIACLAAQGGIMTARRHERSLKSLLCLRIVVGAGLFGIYAYAVYAKLSLEIRERFFGEDVDHVYEFRDGHDVHGWGPVERETWVVVVMHLLILTRLLFVVPAACFLCAVVIPKDSTAHIALGGVERVLRAMGVKDVMISELVKVLMLVMGQGTSELVTPSDVLFGINLVAARQCQGMLYHDAHEEEPRSVEDYSPLTRSPILEPPGESMSKSLVRASALSCSCPEPSRPLRPEDDDADLRALREVNHYVHFAIGIYGAAMEVFAASVYPHSSLASPRYTCSALARFFRGRPRPPDGEPEHTRARVVKDGCFGLNQSAMLRSLEDCAVIGQTLRPELIWATWENRGAGTAPPLGVVLDHENRNLVIAARGTMDAKDCVADLTASPAFFDPMGQAQPEDRREPPFDDQTGLFAHSTILECARDAFCRLEEDGVLDAALAPGGRAQGWGVVCVGHSLGAGVATLLALLLRASGKGPLAGARAVVFEPPGGLLSKKLSELTGKLGFVAAVCANDWISRLSVRAVQELRERVLDELSACDRSKWQLAMLMCGRLAYKSRFLPLVPRLCCCGLGYPLYRLFTSLGGGPLEFKTLPLRPGSLRGGFSQARTEIHASVVASQNNSIFHRVVDSGPIVTDGDLFPELWPPARIMYFRPISIEWWLCGAYQVATEWTAEWVQPEELHELIISPRSAELHFPNILRDAYRSAGRRLGAVAHGPRCPVACGEWSDDEGDEDTFDSSDGSSGSSSEQLLARHARRVADGR